VRPDLVAFRELDALVRNLGDQLAAYRRRALVAETRARELEQQAAAATGALTELREHLEQVQASRDGALRRVATLEREVDQLRSAQETPRSVEGPVSSSRAPMVDTGELVAENEALRARLGEVRVRVSQLGERVRFLRQQANLGGDR
jgi:chromosome segregation ATPase